jgi:hypothetical protein
MTAMVMISSGMDPQMISWNLGWVQFGLVLSKWVLLGCGSVMVRLCDVIEAVTLRS